MTDLAAFHRSVAFGHSGGSILWQPRIQCWYTDKQFEGEPLPAPYTDMSLPEIYRALGCSDRLYNWYNPCFRRVEPESMKRTRRALNETDTEEVTETPVGKTVTVWRRSANSPALIHVRWQVETEEDLKVAAWIEENTTWAWDQATYDKAQAEVGDLGAPTMYMPRMNIQDLYISRMGVENGVFALYDWPDTVEAFFRALEESHDRLIDVINASPVDIINFGENVHAGTLSPDLFERYHLPACRRRCEKLHAAGKFVCSHWDGDCGPLLKYAKDTGLDGIEAITPTPQGDVEIEDIKDALGDELFLLDGIPAIYFDPLYSVETLLDCARKLIDLFAPKLILGISDELSSTGDIERVRLVGDLVDEFNSRSGGA
jgi:hypothetical protein